MHPELSQWHARLNCRRDLMSRPEEHHRELADGAQGMLERGVISPDEWLELCDLITGAYSFAIEQRADELFHMSSAYHVFDPLWAKVGTASRGTLLFDGAKWPLLIRHGEDGHLQAFSGTGFTFLAGSLQGLVLTMENGRRFTLVEVGRYLKGGEYVEAITAPYCFRLALDAIEAARESGDTARASHLSERARVSPFRACPSCLDHFDRREACRPPVDRDWQCTYAAREPRPSVKALWILVARVRMAKSTRSLPSSQATPTESPLPTVSVNNGSSCRDIDISGRHSFTNTPCRRNTARLFAPMTVRNPAELGSHTMNAHEARAAAPSNSTRMVIPGSGSITKLKKFEPPLSHSSPMPTR